MTRALRVLWIAIAFPVMAASVAEAHAKMDSASPAAGSTVNALPNTVTLHFSESLEPKFSGAEVHGPGGDRVDTGSKATGNTIEIGIKDGKPGAYTVDWHVLSVDTHKTKGSYSFTVAH